MGIRLRTEVVGLGATAKMMVWPKGEIIGFQDFTLPQTLALT